MSTIQKQESNNPRYQLVLNDLTNAALIINNEGSITDANKKFCSMIGLPKNGLIGKHIFSFLVRKNKNQFHELFKKQNGNGRRNFELPFHAKNNSKIDAIVTIFPIKNSNGSHEKFMISLVDITHYKQMCKDLEINEIKFQSILAKLEEIKMITGIMMENETGQIRMPISINRKDTLKENSCLTKSELLIAGLVNRGKTTKEIAGSLCLSERTVSNHRQNIRRKRGLVRKKQSNKEKATA